mmetsp:Transcript_21985/g.51282  ORF Transcript_21985/g.51282 Transcript_21985/m.51282 type:complete len:291 (+) Transcript_21985:265-1137(+)
MRRPAMANHVPSHVPKVGPLVVKDEGHPVPRLYVVLPLHGPCVGVETQYGGIEVAVAIEQPLGLVLEQRLLEGPHLLDLFAGLTVHPLHHRVQGVGPIRQDNRLSVRRNTWEIVALVGQHHLPGEGAVLHVVFSQPASSGVWTALLVSVAHVAACVDAAVGPKHAAPIRTSVLVAGNTPNQRARVEVQAVQPAASVHEDRAVLVREERHDVPQAAIGGVGPELRTIGGVNTNGPERRGASVQVDCLGPVHASDQNTVVPLHHVTLQASAQGNLSSPDRAPRVEVEGGHPG